MLTRAQIDAAAEQCRFRVIETEESFVGRRVDVVLRDVNTDEIARIGVWPETTEDDLLYLLTRAAFELRGGYGVNDCQHEWMM